MIPPTRAEAAQINRGIAADPENPEWTDADFARAKPAREILPSRFYQAAVKHYRGQRGPQKSPIKKPITLRVDADILASYKATGLGWQTQMNDALRRGLADDALPWVGGQKTVSGKPLSVKEPGQSGYGKKTQKAQPANSVRRTRSKRIRNIKKAQDKLIHNKDAKATKIRSNLANRQQDLTL